MVMILAIKLYLITGIWAKLQSNIDTMIGENRSFVVFSLL